MPVLTGIACMQLLEHALMGKVKGPHEKRDAKRVRLALLEGRGEFFLRDGLS